MDQGTFPCWDCGKAIDPSDRFCRHCGIGQGTALPWYYEKVWIAVLGVVALGPFVLPFIRRSPRFGSTERLVWMVLALALGAYYAYACYRMFQALRSGMGMLPMTLPM